MNPRHMLSPEHEVPLGGAFRKIAESVRELRPKEDVSEDEGEWLDVRAIGTVTELGTRGVLVSFVLSETAYQGYSTSISAKVKEFARLHNVSLKAGTRRLVAVVDTESTVRARYERYVDPEWDPAKPWAVPVQNKERPTSTETEILEAEDEGKKKSGSKPELSVMLHAGSSDGMEISF